MRENPFTSSRASEVQRRGLSPIHDRKCETVKEMMCTICGHIYDHEKGDAGIDPGIPFESVPADWICPICGAAKVRFVPAR
jgi:rubredoxin